MLSRRAFLGSLSLALAAPALAALPADPGRAQSKQWFRDRGLMPQALTLDEAIADIESRFQYVDVIPKQIRNTLPKTPTTIAKGYELKDGIDKDAKNQSLVFQWYLAALVEVEQSSGVALKWRIRPVLGETTLNGKPYMVLRSRFGMA